VHVETVRVNLKGRNHFEEICASERMCLREVIFEGIDAYRPVAKL
jgi:hypothetical protein